MLKECGRDMNGLCRAQLLTDKWGSKSLSLALFWSQSHAPYMVRTVVTIAFFFFLDSGTFPTWITGVVYSIYALVLTLVDTLTFHKYITWDTEIFQHLPEL